MTNKELGVLLAEEIEKQYIQEIDELDQMVEDSNIQIPEKLDKLLDTQLWKGQKNKRTYDLRWKAACFFITFCMLSAVLCITKPEVVTAIREVFRIISAENTEESLDVMINHSLSSVWKQIEQVVPEDYIITDVVGSRNMERLRYEKDNDYLELTLYNEDYMLSLDNENYANYHELMINGNMCKLIEKNNITTIVFLYHSRLLELESSLPKQDIILTAEKILKK